VSASAGGIADAADVVTDGCLHTDGCGELPSARLADAAGRTRFAGGGGDAERRVGDARSSVSLSLSKSMQILFVVASDVRARRSCVAAVVVACGAAAAARFERSTRPIGGVLIATDAAADGVVPA
jgi:hypothetical protein